MKCSVEVCDRKSSARGFCSPHYYRFMRGDDVSQRIVSRRTDFEKCTLCSKRMVWQDSGRCRPCLIEIGEWKFLPGYKVNKIPCKVGGCEVTARHSYLCGRHYQQWQSGKEFLLEDPRYVRTPCPVSACDRMAVGKAYLCKKHQKVAWRYKIPEIDIPFIYSADAKCHTCGDTERLTIDHDHACCPQNYGTCGKCNRGLLCGHCNSALGMAQESPRVLQGLLDYLENSPGLERA